MADTIKKQKCLRCQHEWFPESEILPKFCPKCHSPYYNKERRNLSQERLLKAEILKAAKAKNLKETDLLKTWMKAMRKTATSGSMVAALTELRDDVLAMEAQPAKGETEKQQKLEGFSQA